MSQVQVLSYIQKSKVDPYSKLQTSKHCIHMSYLVLYPRTFFTIYSEYHGTCTVPGTTSMTY